MTELGTIPVRADALPGDSSSHFELATLGSVNPEKGVIVENGALSSLAVVSRRNF